VSATARRASSLAAAVGLAGCASRSDSGEHGAADRPPTYLGVAEPPLPAGVVSRGGAMLGFDPDATLGVAWVGDGAGELLWLQRLLRRDADGIAHWTVVDEVRLPPRGADDVVILGNCVVGEPAAEPEGRVFAVVRREPRPILAHVMAAWTVDEDAPRLVPAAADEVRCIHEGFDG
jgi:hypothetical protein